MFSIIIPIYNSSKYIKKCIKSVEHAFYKYDYELLLINDGSTDNSLEICEELKLLNPKIKVFNQENKGVSAARNLGLDNASREWVIFVDSDDEIKENDYDFIVDKKIDFYIYGNGIVENKVLSQIECYKDYTSYIMGLSKKNLQNLHLKTVWSKFYKNSILQTCHIRFNTKMYHGEDSIFNINYLNNIKNIKLINFGFYKLNYNESSITHSFHKDVEENEHEYLENLSHLILDKTINLDLCYLSSIITIINQKIYNIKNEVSYLNKRKNMISLWNNNIKYLKIKNVRKMPSKKDRIYLLLFKYKMFYVLYIIANLKKNKNNDSYYKYI